MGYRLNLKTIPRSSVLTYLSQIMSSGANTVARSAEIDATLNALLAQFAQALRGLWTSLGQAGVARSQWLLDHVSVLRRLRTVGVAGVAAGFFGFAAFVTAAIVGEAVDPGVIAPQAIAGPGGVEGVLERSAIELLLERYPIQQPTRVETPEAACRIIVRSTADTNGIPPRFRELMDRARGVRNSLWSQLPAAGRP